jgi:hypothetical protein
VGLLVAGGSSPAWPESIALTWSTCTGPSTRTTECASESEVHRLVVSVEVDADVDSVIGAEVVVDLQAASGQLPDWWAFGPAGCRQGSLLAGTGAAAVGPCPDVWAGFGTALVQGFSPGQPRGQSGQARILAVAGVPSNQPATLAPGTVYGVLRLQFDSQHTISPPACAGCEEAVCLVLNSVRLIRLPGAAVLPDLVVPAAGDRAWARWQSESGGSCAAVPVRRTTWGRIKSQYR